MRRRIDPCALRRGDDPFFLVEPCLADRVKLGLVICLFFFKHVVFSPVLAAIILFPVEDYLAGVPRDHGVESLLKIEK